MLALKSSSTRLEADVYNDIKGRIYSPLIDSAKHYSPQAGETYDVVEVDIDPAANNGNEYIVVEPTHVIQTDRYTHSRYPLIKKTR